MTCITKPGTEWTKENDDGTVSHRVYHLGMRNVDVNYEYDRSKYQDKAQEGKQAEAEAAKDAPKEAPKAAPAAKPAPKAPEGEVEGFEVSDDSFEAEFT